MKNIAEKVSYIFRYKEAGEERKQAQLFVLSYLRKCFSEMEIIVVEQGERQTLFPPEAWNINVILEEYTGVFNRCRPYNMGAAAAKGAILVFGDGDIFLKKEDYLTCFKATETFEAITPNKDLLLNVAIEDFEKHTFKFLKKRRLTAFAGGMVMFTRTGFDKIGGWDERFVAWGHEDMAMSFLIFQKLRSKTFFLDFYHIDHPRTLADTDQHSGININETLRREIGTFNGQAIENYIDILKNQQLPVEKTGSKKPKFILAITPRNGLKNLKSLVDSFSKTKSDNADWTLIISDNGASDGVRDWVKNLKTDYPIFLIENDQVSNVRQENQLLKKMSEMDFDLCFKSNDEVVFLGKGWDQLYWEAIQKTGYDHFIFYDINRKKVKNSDFPIKRGNLIAHCPPENCQGVFFTLTPRALKQVGFMDEQLLNKNNGLSVLDYMLRACRLGFNVLSYPFDVKNSNKYIRLQPKKNELEEENHTRPTLKDFRLKTQILLKGNRGFLPYHENDFVETLHSTKGIESTSEEQARFSKPVPKKCDATYYSGRGVGGSLGFLLRRFYNLAIDYRLYFIPKKIKKIGLKITKFGEDLVNIDG